ncbi:hypothetical protein, partial [Aquabacterium sp.]|uniref:hypothetical protein n=1 Tax=Aquabacterium sp. TaxID=1872578 RepID=UPI0035C7003B
MNGDGEISEGELAAAMGGPGSLAQHHHHHHHLAQHHHHHHLAQVKQTPEQIMGLCDTDGSGGLTKKEIDDCIDANVSDAEDAAEMKADVDAGFADADINGDGEIDEAELAAAMGGPGSLAQHHHHHHLAQHHHHHHHLAQVKQTPEQIMGMCDTDGSGGLTMDEIND